ncbi:MAG TPA: NAD-dependent deacylase [Pseudogracilibacillus sp.]|nr:NAD-dependent deacylase [Pseudogracilibacillus sp.]
MKAFANLLLEANHVVVFTGAGMSTESGLDDFRTKTSGLWERFNPQELATVDALTHNREQFIQFYRYRLQAVFDAGPHEGHHILNEWEKNKTIQSIITQNVDGFHSLAGNRKVRELHGSFSTFYCHDCQAPYEATYFLENAQCHCGGTIRPSIVLFGEGLPQNTFQIAEKDSLQADLFIVLGSSLTVSPANMFPSIAKENGAKLIIVNKDPTPYDHLADLLIQDDTIKHVLTSVNDQLKNE